MYLTNVLDPRRLPGPYAPRLYAERWRIEEAFAVLKRLLGLAYLWNGASNTIQTQVWATWLLYGVLLDLVDEVAEREHLATARISVEMVFRGLTHYAQAVADGEPLGVVEYLVRHTKVLGLVKLQPPRGWHPCRPTLGVSIRTNFRLQTLDMVRKTLTCE